MADETPVDGVDATVLPFGTAVPADELFAATLDTTDVKQLLRFVLDVQALTVAGPLMPADTTEAIAFYRGVPEWIEKVKGSLHHVVATQRADMASRRALDWLTAYAAAGSSERTQMRRWMEATDDTDLQVRVGPVVAAMEPPLPGGVA